MTLNPKYPKSKYPKYPKSPKYPQYPKHSKFPKYPVRGMSRPETFLFMGTVPVLPGHIACACMGFRVSGGLGFGV